jgi:TPR repeat protein
MKVAKNYDKAFELYLQAAEKGTQTGMIWTGRLYLNGRGTVQDYSKAAEWYLKAGETGKEYAVKEFDALAQSHYSNGNFDEAMKLYEIADGIDGGNRRQAEGLFQTGKQYHLNKQYDQAYEHFLKAAEYGSVDAMYWIGLMFMKNLFGGIAKAQIMEKDNAAAFGWLESAATKGHVDAMFRVYGMYLGGIGVEKNQSKCVEWLMKAVEKELPQAMEGLSYYHEGGLLGGPKMEGIEKDKTKAKEWAAKAKEAKKKGKYKYMEVKGYTGVLDDDKTVKK